MDFLEEDQFAENNQIKSALVNSPTGIKGFDKAMNGGFPKGSVVLVSGSSGSGKTIFCFEWLFHGTKQGENTLYVTLTEPLFNTLKNLETMDFYDRDAVEEEQVKVIDMRDYLTQETFNEEKIISFIEEQVQLTNAKRLCIDSITAIAYMIDKKSEIRKFIFELGKVLATLGCTTLLTSEVPDETKYSIYDVEEFISDVIIRLDRKKIKDEVHRKINIVKVRGRATILGERDFKISTKGFEVIPKLEVKLHTPKGRTRISIGNKFIDTLLHGGLFKGSTTLLAGMAGTGKSLISALFVLEGLNNQEYCLYLSFEESEQQIIHNTESFKWDLKKHLDSGLLTLLCQYPHEKLLEEHLFAIKKIIEEKKITRCVVDSLSAIHNEFDNDEFVDFTKRLNGYLKSRGVTAIFTLASGLINKSVPVADAQITTIADNMIMLRHVEMEGELQKVMNIVKFRGSSHSKNLTEYDIAEKGFIVGESLEGFEGIMTGVSRKVRPFEGMDSKVAKKILTEFFEDDKPAKTKKNLFSRTQKQNTP